VGGQEVRVHRESRAGDDGYRSALLPGVRASADANLLAEEIAFAHGRLLALGAAPPDLYAEVRARAADDIERATWMCFLIAYLSPLDGDQPFVAIRMVLDAAAGDLPGADVSGELAGIALGPRTSHDPARAVETLLAYRHWTEHADRSGAHSPEGWVGQQTSAFTGDPEWSPQRRFERMFERLALPGFRRIGRYDLLVTLGRLGLYELRADALHFTSGPETSSSDLATLAAKRVFAIGDPLNLERRARALAEAIAVPIETLDLALANWGAGRRATLGFRADTCDRHALERCLQALEL
jgi:hypothetical protein